MGLWSTGESTLRWKAPFSIRTAGLELRVCIGVKKVQQCGRKFSGGPGPTDFLQVLVRRAVIDLHVTITFLGVFVNDFSRNHVQGRFLAASLAEPRHELLANKVRKLL